MPLPTPTRFGPYETVSFLGAGGMGEVYEAIDTRLNRRVALKVLPPHLVADEERRRRFVQEAQLASYCSIRISSPSTTSDRRTRPTTSPWNWCVDARQQRPVADRSARSVKVQPLCGIDTVRRRCRVFA